MTPTEKDHRSPNRRSLDEEIAAQPSLPLPLLPPDAISSSVEVHLNRVRRRPVALAGIVENGAVHFLDPDVKLPEHSRVIIVAEGSGCGKDVST